MKKAFYNRNSGQNRPGIILLITLVLLVVMSILGYTLSSQVLTQRHRNQYIIDYSKARYGCDSAVKYALATLKEIDPQLVSRPNEPDFSDLFALNEAERQELLAKWQLQSGISAIGDSGRTGDKIESSDTSDFNDVYLVNDFGSMRIRGPYGPEWPLISEPEEFDIGSVKVKIEIEDENAKYPLGWALLNYPEMTIESEVGFVTFCEMAGLESEQIESLKYELNKIGDVKPFKLEFKPITRVVRTPVPSSRATNRSSTRRTPTTTRVQRKVTTIETQIFEQTSYFARLFHSSLLDTEALARPNTVTGNSKETALKYIGTWGSRKVNINTAPRHVLEAAFIFGGNEVEIAEEIIQRRRKEPFTDIADLKDSISKYRDSISACEEYISTRSTFFTIKITAVSGVAKASSVIAITKTGDRVERIALING